MLFDAAGVPAQRPAGGVAGQQGAAAGPAAEGAPAGSEPAEAEVREPPDKERRNQRDAQAPQGRATCDTAGRTLTSLGPLQEREPRFAAASAVSGGGVLTAVPALVQARPAAPRGPAAPAQGLLRGALDPAAAGVPAAGARAQSGAAALRAARGMGCLAGLDRCPCDRTLRRRTRQLVADTAALEAWRGALARDWAGADPEAVATLFVDGHFQVYSGPRPPAEALRAAAEAVLPAAASYWVGALGGAPLLCVHKQVDPATGGGVAGRAAAAAGELGLLPAAQEPSRPRLTLVFDREGWSPALFAQLAERGIAVITWRKGPQAERWPDSEFVPARLAVHAPGGEQALEGPHRRAQGGSGERLRGARDPLLDRPAPAPAGQERPAAQAAGAGGPAGGGRAPAGDPHHALPRCPRSGSRACCAHAGRRRTSSSTCARNSVSTTLAEHALVGVDADERVVNPLWRWLERALRRLRGKAGHLHRKLGSRARRAFAEGPPAPGGDRRDRAAHHGPGTGGKATSRSMSGPATCRPKSGCRPCLPRCGTCSTPCA